MKPKWLNFDQFTDNKPGTKFTIGRRGKTVYILDYRTPLFTGGSFTRYNGIEFHAEKSGRKYAIRENTTQVYQVIK